MKVAVEKYRKPDGYATRYWSVTVNGELLAVTLDASPIARGLRNVFRAD
jgi:hypothetical protein